MQNILAKKSTPGRRAAKRDRAARIGEIEQAVLSVPRLAWTWMKQLGQALAAGADNNTVQVILITLAVGLLIGSGFTESLVDGWLGQ